MRPPWSCSEFLEDGVIPGLSLPSSTQPGDSRMRAWVRGVGAETVGAARDRPRVGREPGDTCTGGPRPSGLECSGTAPEPRHSPPALPPSCPQTAASGGRRPGPAQGARPGRRLPRSTRGSPRLLDPIAGRPGLSPDTALDTNHFPSQARRSHQGPEQDL